LLRSSGKRNRPFSNLLIDVVGVDFDSAKRTIKTNSYLASKRSHVVGRVPSSAIQEGRCIMLLNDLVNLAQSSEYMAKILFRYCSKRRIVLARNIPSHSDFLMR
jgi:hypothetical protein